MKVRLYDGYYIDIDNLNHTLKRKMEKTREDGTTYESERIVGYYGNLVRAVEGFLKEVNVTEDVEVSLMEYAHLVEESNKRTAEMIARWLESAMT